MIESEIPVCPDCGGTSIESTTMGYFMLPPLEDHDHDPNLHLCYSCGFRWKRSCLVCGEVSK